MSQTDKAAFYQELKEAGVKFDRHYREYSTDELEAAVRKLRENPEYNPPPVQAPPVKPAMKQPTVAPEQYAAQTAYQNTDEETPIRVDPTTGYVWFREEVRKPAFPKPRARRKLTYIETGVETKTVINGKYLETFEVAGEGQSRGEVRITMPSYQVGVYRDPRFPFKVHVYNEMRGFDLFDVQAFYGGSDLVPAEILRVYIENDLCYDIRTTIRSIQAEDRELRMRGGRA